MIHIKTLADMNLDSISAVKDDNKLIIKFDDSTVDKNYGDDEYYPLLVKANGICDFVLKGFLPFHGPAGIMNGEFNIKGFRWISSISLNGCHDGDLGGDGIMGSIFINKVEEYSYDYIFKNIFFSDAFEVHKYREGY
ncbi:hypothetical protein FACS189461_0550 [Spirochaetia bacterium]|nr:hypothetical protein FACS189461_0550 [Spirochaetia bacterium]